MELPTIVVALSALVGVVLLTGIVHRILLARDVLDVPNQRSSHFTPTPLGGGLAIVFVTTISLAVLTFFGTLPSESLIALGVGGAGVALVGFLDDHHKVSARLRIAVHLAAAIWALFWLGGVPPLQIGDQLVSLGAAGYVLGALGIAWALNLFNFMDGIDGIAASEATFVAIAGGTLAFLNGSSDVVPAIAIVFGAACCGFLTWNWPPAKIFMGDVGSGYLGYMVAVLAVMAARENPVALLVWLVLGGVFFVDATLTLLRRLIKRERFYEAHRSHAYQVLARRWRSHTRVTMTITLVNFFWLLPCAWVAMTHPRQAAWITFVALAPLVVAGFAAGTGRYGKEPL